MDEIYNKMESGEAAMVPYYVGDYILMKDVNPDLSFVYPEEGVNCFVDAMCIPKCTQNYEAAMLYINFMLDPEIALSNALYIGYASPNKAVKDDPLYGELLSANYDTEFVDAWEVLYGKNKDEANANYHHNPAYENYKNEGVDIQAHVNSLWESLKTENSTEPWIHVTSIAIIVGVISLAAYNTYIKKKRSRDYRLRDKMKQQNKQKETT
jgi:spermidine/putrescine transport system substrate-binding protein